MVINKFQVEKIKKHDVAYIAYPRNYSAMELPARISLNSLIFSLKIYIVDFLDLREVVTLVNRWSQTCGLPVGGCEV